MRKPIPPVALLLTLAACGEVLIPPSAAPLGEVETRTASITATSTAGFPMTVLPTLGGNSAAYGIDSHGHAVGVSEYALGGEPRAVLWMDGAIIDLGAEGGAVACDINDNHEIVGVLRVQRSDPRAFLWKNSRKTTIERVSHTQHCPVSINASGRIAGTRLSGPGVNNAYWWENDTTRALGGPTPAFVYGLNRDGHIVGYAGSRIAYWHPANYGSPWYYGTAVATAINDAMEWVGYEPLASGPQMPFRAPVGGPLRRMEELGVPTIPHALNNAGVVVGSSASKAVMWIGTALTDLGGLTTRPANALGINAAGQVAGFSDDAFFLRAVIWDVSGATNP